MIIGDEADSSLQLRDYQKQLVQRSLRGENDIIILPTGTGKTYIAIEVILYHLNRHGETGKLTFTLHFQSLKKNHFQVFRYRFVSFAIIELACPICQD